MCRVYVAEEDRNLTHEHPLYSIFAEGANIIAGGVTAIDLSYSLELVAKEGCPYTVCFSLSLTRYGCN